MQRTSILPCGDFTIRPFCLTQSEFLSQRDRALQRVIVTLQPTKIQFCQFPRRYLALRSNAANAVTGKKARSSSVEGRCGAGVSTNRSCPREFEAGGWPGAD